MGILGRSTEKALLQEATFWMIEAIPLTMNTTISNGKLLKNMGLSFVGTFTLLTILLMGIGRTAAQDLINNPFAGKALYQTHCLRCHGSLGDGKGPDAATLMVPPRDFHTAESTARNEYELRSIIIWGLVFSPMHSWGHSLTPQEIRNLISYIRQLAPYQPRI
jgi:mono/diheme cytochrome c family protein